MNTDAFFKITYGLYVVSTTFEGRDNGFIANTVFQVTAKPAQFAVACSKNNFSAELIRKSGVFAFSVLRQDARAEIIGTFGYQSGRDTNKFSGLSTKRGSTGAPILLDDSLAWFECRIVQTLDVGTHLIFIGELVDGDTIGDPGEPLTYAWYREMRKGKAPKNAPTYIEISTTQASAPPAAETAHYTCAVCGYTYDPAKGDPKHDIPPGTPFEKLNDEWTCPLCHAPKTAFAKK